MRLEWDIGGVFALRAHCVLWIEDMAKAQRFADRFANRIGPRSSPSTPSESIRKIGDASKPLKLGMHKRNDPFRHYVLTPGRRVQTGTREYGSPAIVNAAQSYGCSQPSSRRRRAAL